MKPPLSVEMRSPPPGPVRTSTGRPVTWQPLNPKVPGGRKTVAVTFLAVMDAYSSEH